MQTLILLPELVHYIFGNFTSDDNKKYYYRLDCYQNMLLSLPDLDLSGMSLRSAFYLTRETLSGILEGPFSFPLALGAEIPVDIQTISDSAGSKT